MPGLRGTVRMHRIRMTLTLTAVLVSAPLCSALAQGPSPATPFVMWQPEAMPAVARPAAFRARPRGQLEGSIIGAILGAIGGALLVDKGLCPTASSESSCRPYVIGGGVFGAVLGFFLGRSIGELIAGSHGDGDGAATADAEAPGAVPSN